MKRFVRILDAVSEWSGRVVCWLVLVFTLTLGWEIVMRYVFNAPTKWAFDTSYMLGGTYFWLGVGYTSLKKGHVRIDIFYRKFSRRAQALIDVCLTLLFFFPLWGILLYRLIPYVYLSWITQERSMQGYWMPVLYPFKTVMPVGAALLLLQGVADFLRSLCVLVGRGEERA